MKLDILAFGAHPDDVELCCGGTLLKHIAAGHSVGIIDMTRGELGTRGTAETRDREAAESAKVLGVAFRNNLGFRDGFFANDEQHQLEVIRHIRLHQPEIVLCNAVNDRHTDHGMGAALISKSCFLSGLRKIETQYQGAYNDPECNDTPHVVAMLTGVDYLIVFLFFSILIKNRILK